MGSLVLKRLLVPRSQNDGAGGLFSWPAGGVAGVRAARKDKADDGWLHRPPCQGITALVEG